MKNIFLICVLPLLLLQSCSKDEETVIPRCDDCEFTCLAEGETENVITNVCKDNWQCTYTILADSKVDIGYGQGVSEGDQMVFQLINSTQGAPEIADDEVSIFLVFELDSTLESFSVDDDMLNALNVQYIAYCFCPDVEFTRPSSGCLQGEKQEDETWFVQGNLLFDDFNNGDYDLKVEAQFSE